MIFGRKYIIDRYIFDIAINASLTRNKNLDFAQRLIEIFFRILPKPDMVIFIDLPEKIAMARKDDIPDIEYLTERRKRYLGLSKKYNLPVANAFHAGDGNLHPLIMYDANEKNSLEKTEKFGKGTAP